MPPVQIIYIAYFGVFYLSCFLIGCLFVRKNWPLEYKLLVVLSGLTLLVEATVFLYHFRRIDGRWIYDFFSPVECGFIIYIFYRASVHPAIRRLNAILLGCLAIGIGIGYVLYPAFFKLSDSTELFYLFAELIAACSFLIDVLLNKSDIPPGRHPLFWMACGMLFYCSIYTVITAVTNYVTKLPYELFMLYSFVANTFMYTGFIACFICLHRIRPLPAASHRTSY